MKKFVISILMIAMMVAMLTFVFAASVDVDVGDREKATNTSVITMNSTTINVDMVMISTTTLFAENATTVPVANICNTNNDAMLIMTETKNSPVSTEIVNATTTQTRLIDDARSLEGGLPGYIVASTTVSTGRTTKNNTEAGFPLRCWRVVKRGRCVPYMCSI